MSNAAKNFDILAISLSVLHNYFNSKLLFWSVSAKSYPAKIRSFSKTILFVYLFSKICLFLDFIKLVAKEKMLLLL